MESRDPRPPRPVREADRDEAVGLLREAYAEGHLTHEEMDERLDRVLAVRTHDELTAALASVPVPADTTSTIAAAGGRIVRRGPWRVPRFLKVASAFGRVRLDLSRAVFTHPVVDIELELGTGRARITVPRDAVVELDGLTAGWKDPRYTPRRSARTDGPTIRISGTMGFGRLRVRHALRRGAGR
ncbi:MULTISPECIES: DUF1707 SHOCT-like domain-containing protein [Streptomyces]|uniref:DUF1707 SHOCT-like domain-containing protein n=1 Tax=Streptomyces TaxID=1883 RepID=UPI0006EB8D13|nr:MULTISPECIES: DUF1707 domain-containing protein [Streptomyces]